MCSSAHTPSVKTEFEVVLAAGEPECWFHCTWPRCGFRGLEMTTRRWPPRLLGSRFDGRMSERRTPCRGTPGALCTELMCDVPEHRDVSLSRHDLVLVVGLFLPVTRGCKHTQRPACRLGYGPEKLFSCHADARAALKGRIVPSRPDSVPRGKSQKLGSLPALCVLNVLCLPGRVSGPQA